MMKKTFVILLSISKNLTKKFQIKWLIPITSRFDQHLIKVSAFIEVVVQVLVVYAAIFRAVLLFFFVTF